MEIITERKEKVIYRDGDKVVKMFSKKYPKSDILNEALNQSRVEETGLPIPQLTSVNIIDGKWAIVMDYVEGKTLQQLMDEDSENIDKYMDRFIDIQMLIHSKKCPLLSKIKDKMNRKITATNGLIDATIRYELHTRLDGMPKHNKLCHGDFNPSNIIIDENDNFYILDWSHATQGNASADAARTYLCFALKDKAMADKYMNMYCKKSDTAMQYIQRWLPIVAASQLVKRIPGEEDFLLSWVDVVDWQ